MFNTLQNGRRAKLETADGNEIDTMFMDKRSPSENIQGNGENLVIFYLNNSTVCSFSAVRENRPQKFDFVEKVSATKYSYKLFESAGQTETSVKPASPQMTPNISEAPKWNTANHLIFQLEVLVSM